MEEFRLLDRSDREAYHLLLVGGYQASKEVGIDFKAADFSPQDSYQWLEDFPTYGLWVDDVLVSSISLRLPWSKKPGPSSYPHLGHVVTDPNHKRQGYAYKTLTHLEEVLVNLYKTPKITLGTAAEHHWLCTMFESWGFRRYQQTTLPGNKHVTIYFEKSL